MILVPILRPDQGKHVALDLQIIYACLAKGQNVRAVICDTEGQYCPVHDYNGDPYLQKCGTCKASILRLHDILSALSREFKGQLDIAWLSAFDNAIDTYFYPSRHNWLNKISRTTFELRPSSIDYSGIDDMLLPPYVSETLSNTGLTLEDLNPMESVDDKPSKILEERMELNRGLSLRIEKHFESLLEGVSHAYIFNGRMAAQKTVLRCCRKKGIKAFIHEVGFFADTFTVYPGYSLDEHVPLQPRSHFVRSPTYSSNESTGICEELKELLVGKLSSATRNHSFYSVAQLLNIQSPRQIIHDKPTISLFLSSTDEISSVYPFDQSKYERLLVKHLAKRLSQGTLRNAINVYIRFHPRSARQLERAKLCRGAFYRFHEELCKSADNNCNIVVLSPDRDISSYALLRSTDIAISLFSVIAAEAGCFVPLTISHEYSRASPFTHLSIRGVDPEAGAESLINIFEKILGRHSHHELAELKNYGKQLANSYAKAIKKCSFADQSSLGLTRDAIEPLIVLTSKFEQISMASAAKDFIHTRLYD